MTNEFTEFRLRALGKGRGGGEDFHCFVPQRSIFLPMLLLIVVVDDDEVWCIILPFI